MSTRRAFLRDSPLAAAGMAVQLRRRIISSKAFDHVPHLVTQLEVKHGGRIGVCILDTATGKSVGHRMEERFPMCSTFKFLLAAAILNRVDGGTITLAKTVPVPPKPLLGHSPLTEPNAGGTMTVAELCHATLTQSDNTAANLLLDVLSGPPAVTAFARLIGDTVTRLDRNEPDLNSSIDGDPRDTTTPAVMVQDLRRVLVDKVLKPVSRQQIVEWMEGSITGLERLRKDAPESWRIADKTGSNGEHTTNDVAVLWPTNREPVCVAVYITQCPGPETKRGAIIAEIGRYVREAILLG